MKPNLKLLVVSVTLGYVLSNAHAVGTRKFIQVSDFHLDLDYKEKSSVKSFCHTSLDDIQASDDDLPTIYGHNRCDSPARLVKATIRQMRKVLPDPDFILWTGDNSPHGNGTAGKDVYKNLKFIGKWMHKEFNNSLVIPALGNHDSNPPDTFSDRILDSNGASKQYKGYLKSGALKEFIPDVANFGGNCGYYAVRNSTIYGSNITQTFLVLNTNLYHPKNLKNVDKVDPCNQLQWLDEQLRKSTGDERVFIVAHIPPGYFELWTEEPFFGREDITDKYLGIVGKPSYAKKIVAHFYGHTHTSGYRLFFQHPINNVGKEPVGVGFIAPSVTPLMYQGGVNPSFRVYEYDPELRKIITFKQHYLPLGDIDITTERTEKVAATTVIPPSSRVSKTLNSDDDSAEERRPILSSGRRSNGKRLQFTDSRRKRQASQLDDTVTELKENVTSVSEVETAAISESKVNTDVGDSVVKSEKKIGLGAPPYLSVPKWQNCTGSYSPNSSTHSEHCLPLEKPSGCPDSSWSSLQGKWPASQRCPMSNQENIGLGAPPYLSIPQWQNCTDRQSPDSSDHIEHCLPREKPSSCPDSSWDSLQQTWPENGRCPASNNQKGLDTPAYLSVPNWPNCTDTYTPEQKDNQTSEAQLRAYCLPTERPESCPESSWNSLKSVWDGIECSNDNSSIGLDAPTYLSVPDWKKCTNVHSSKGVKNTSVATPHSEYCLPKEMPEMCPESSWNSLKSVWTGTTCQNSEHKISNETMNNSSTRNGSEPVDTDRKTDADTPSSNSTTKQNTSSILSASVLPWKSFDARSDLQISEMSVSQMFKAYKVMKNDQNSTVFANFYRDLSVRRDIGECEPRRHAQIMCVMVHYKKKALDDCMMEEGYVLTTPVVPEASITLTPSNQPTTEITTTDTTKMSISSSTNTIFTSTDSGGNSANVPEPVTKAPPGGQGKKPSASQAGDAEHTSSSSVLALAILMALVFIVVVGGVSFWYYRRARINRYRSQEFLLTDSVFKYDGYSQLDQP